MVLTTLRQERRELWNSILDEVRLSEAEPDPARAAACSYLLGHLIHSAVPPARFQCDADARQRAFRISPRQPELLIHRNYFFEDVRR